jgi:hypothetical protein
MNEEDIKDLKLHTEKSLERLFYMLKYELHMNQITEKSWKVINSILETIKALNGIKEIK